MKYAVIESGGKQYKVAEGEIVTVDKLEHPQGKKFLFDKVLLFKDGQEVLVGNPYLAGLTVSGEVTKQYKGEKLHVSKFKAKVRYRRKIGFRPMLTDIKIENIGRDASPKKAPSTKVAAKREKKIDNRENRE
ncbi:MAG: 50S ribosomal protein L21, large subunit ribosomal protein L21 [Candidatus Gottesmanbacteria bacterium GW2011_GWA2_43_14]|uniref:Large ribosomal subunit protein bL21 n=1 Tax=Candidatus Gottesmanbacteria bacterium GW2011_GWA2_43_14 TaxID=1618443 RepID=A0A0G1DLM4_9BACT|nr:MAG: 50S ribosomal protein L21, large subunit ribosomal protein L21 [Candidatus Gottesmanbacteria bacterium GW2011_GWA2_43_14]